MKKKMLDKNKGNCLVCGRQYPLKMLSAEQVCKPCSKPKKGHLLSPQKIQAMDLSQSIRWLEQWELSQPKGFPGDTKADRRAAGLFESHLLVLVHQAVEAASAGNPVATDIFVEFLPGVADHLLNAQKDKRIAACDGCFSVVAADSFENCDSGDCRIAERYQRR